MKKILFLIVALSFVIGCTEETINKKSPFQKASGGRYYGGVFKLNESDHAGTLFPHMIVDAISVRIAYQIYEGLVKFNQADLSIQPGLAESWVLDSTATTYTFKLHKGVKFHDDPCFEGGKGREITAYDIKYCFQLLCTSSNINQGFVSTFKDILKGANEYYEASRSGKPNFELEGVEVLDDHTLKLTLEKPFSSFIYTLALHYATIFPKEAYTKYKEKMTIGTGPFTVTNIEKGKSIVLIKNPNYYKYDKFGNQLPFLDSIKITFLQDRKQEIDMFKLGKLDMVYKISTDEEIEIRETKRNNSEEEQYNSQSVAEMSVQYYGFLNNEGVFKNKNLRKAFNYAIDKNLIANKILEGEVYATGVYGITPPIFHGYDVTQIKGYSIDIKKAKMFLAQAGYPDGKNLPKISLDVNSGRGRNIAVAEEIKKQLKENINVDIEINVLDAYEKLNKEKKGDFMLVRAGWIADYPNPQNFLSLLYGRNVPQDMGQESFPNTARYVNTKFDNLYHKGLDAGTLEESYKYFIEAEKIAMEDAPLMILWYEEGYRILQPNVKNFPNNAMQYRDFSEVWFDQSSDDQTDLEAKR